MSMTMSEEGERPMMLSQWETGRAAPSSSSSQAQVSGSYFSRSMERMQRRSIHSARMGSRYFVPVIIYAVRSGISGKMPPP